MKTPSSRKYITLNVIRRANRAMMERAAGCERPLSSRLNAKAPTLEELAAAGAEALRRFRESGQNQGKEWM